ncbi:endonuclease G [Arthrobacter globiformis]|uniref:DNA/RNA non-specific endonuclease n=1 Tax=Arthrobacter globiformis TaxID=1665 RepID=UPI0027837AF1|nr:DNA/RNA non-specific endonuclease [Arthrobacter globiformis]MDQ1057152.1 endonuclease G [Arthrobacter globiformis]
MGTMGEGYDPGFLREALELPGPEAPTILLDYTHFSVRLLPARRLAAVTGVNIDGQALVPLGREGTWHYDPRVPRGLQTGPDVYQHNDLDRGHLVRRLDPVWGDDSTALTANQDTFTYPNAAPQAAAFNQGKELWAGLEDHVLNHAGQYDARISVFTGPVLDAGDLPYRGIQIPRKFWKIAAWTTDGRLAAAGFLLDQSPLLGPEELARVVRERLLADEPPPLGPYRTFQVPIPQIAALTGMVLTRLADADRFTAGIPEGGPGPAAIALTDLRQVRL